MTATTGMDPSASPMNHCCSGSIQKVVPMTPFVSTRTRCFHLFFISAIGAASAAAQTDGSAEVTRWTSLYPGARLVFQGRDQFISYGGPQTVAATPQLAVAGWLADFRAAAGVPELELRELWSAKLSDRPRVVFALEQHVAGIPVDGAVVRIVVDESPKPTVIFAAGNISRSAMPDLTPGIDAAAALFGLRQDSANRELTEWSGGERVIIRDSEDHSAKVAWRFVGDTGRAVLQRERRAFFVDVPSGRLLAERDEILRATIAGNVFGNATPGTLPDLPANPAQYVAVPGIITTTLSVSDVTGPLGEFALNVAGGGAANVACATSQGQWVTVHNTAGADLGVTAPVSPGVNGALILNGLPSELNTAQLNTFVAVTRAHDFFRERSNFSAIDVPIPAYVNQTGMCNAYYDQGSLNFFRAQSGCADSAYSTIVAHEYGHFIVTQLGLGQGAFGEGFADALAMLMYQTPTIGEQFFSSGSAMRNPGTDNRQYPCSGEIHYCGELLAGVWWDIRKNLSAIYGANGDVIVAQLFVDWAQITGGGSGTNYTNSAYPQTVVEVLTVDDDDDELANGTPNRDAICAAFAAHGIQCPPLPALLFQYPGGLPNTVAPSSAKMLTVMVRAAGSAPTPATGTLTYAMNGGAFTTVPMSQTAPNEYQAILPAMPCGSNLRYYFSARTVEGVLVMDPPQGATSPYVTTAAQATSVVFSDDFQSNRGWTYGATGDTATTGVWNRLASQATAAQPAGGHGGTSDLCAVTDGNAGSSTSSYDVDNGITTLLTPVLDLSSLADGVLSYWRWYSNSVSSQAPSEDVFDVYVTNDLLTWKLVERVGPSGAEAQGGWYAHQFRVTDFVIPTSTVRLKFVASDMGGSSTVEAAVDDLQVNGFLCNGAGCPRPGCDFDLAANCLIDLQDLMVILAEFGHTGVGVPADLNGNGVVDLADLSMFLATYGNDCR